MLTGVARALTAGEISREPRSLGVIAYFDGYMTGAYGRRNAQTYPRRLTRNEEADWREGFAEGRTERVCHSWHGFIPHDRVDPHPLALCPEPHPPILREGKTPCQSPPSKRMH